MSRQPVCVACLKFMRCERNDVTVEETMQPPDPAQPHVSYRLWQADLWKCEDCGHQVITGFGRGPSSEMHQQTHDENRKRAVVARTERGFYTVRESS